MNMNLTQADFKQVRGKSHTVIRIAVEFFPQNEMNFLDDILFEKSEEIYVNLNFSWLFVTIYIFSGILIFAFQLFLLFFLLFLWQTQTNCMENLLV